MTLLEMMMVLLILSGLVAGGFYMMGMLTHSNLKEEAMRFSTITQYTYDQAALNSRQYRLVIDLDEHKYHTEVTESRVVIDEDSDEASDAFDEGLMPEEARRLEEERRAERGDLFREEEHDPFGVSRRTGYQRAEDAVVEPRELRNGIEFESVRVESRTRAVRSGRVAISFFPNGLQQQAQVVLVDPSTGAKYTLITEPLTGRILIYSGEREVDDDFGEVEYEEY